MRERERERDREREMLRRFPTVITQMELIEDAPHVTFLYLVSLLDLV